MSDERTSTPYQRPAGGPGQRPSGGPGGPRKKRPFQRRKVCRFCAEKNLTIDYKEPRTLRYFISERGKIVPRRISGNCSRHQREITEAIKRARNLALLPVASTHVLP
ncbi:MAG: 30S ribosomal protein S18 [Deltaproteobacteria bacterium]|nr:30S ribosomal protein S18 [Deltaproteobacteria bacterium]